MSFELATTTIGNPYFFGPAIACILVAAYTATRWFWMEKEPKDFNVYQKRSHWKRVIDYLLRT